MNSPTSRTARVLERLRAADPVPEARPPSDREVEAVLAAAKNAGQTGRTTPRRPMTRRLLLGGAAASVIGLVAVPSLLARRDSAFAAPLRALAQGVATAPPPGADVLYANWRLAEIYMESSGPDDQDPILTRTVWSIEEWHPLQPHAYQPYGLQNSTSDYLTPADAQRGGTELSPELRRRLGLPPEGRSKPKETTPVPMCERSQCAWTWPNRLPSDHPATVSDATASFVRELPADPGKLRALIADSPALDRFHNYNWSPSDTWNRIANWEEMRDQRYSRILLDLLKFAPTPQPVRAALIELLAEVHSIVVYGNRTVGGRSGLAIGYEGHPRADVMVIDHETGLLIKDQWTLDPRTKASIGRLDLPVGTVMKDRTLVELAYVSSIGDHP